MLASLKKSNQRVKGLVNQFLQLVISPENQTYHPGTPQKSKWHIWKDNLTWLIKNREINRYYYIYGMDRKQNNLTEHVMGYRRFTQIRDSRNLRLEGKNFNYASVLRDKFIFGQFVSSLHVPTPRNIALLDSDSVTWLDTMQVNSLRDIAADPNTQINGFCKMLTGLQGKGAFPLRITGNKIYIDEVESSVAELAKKINGNYLLQERIVQHPEIDRLHKSSLNTMRIVTFNIKGKIQVFYGGMRIGTHNKTVDNWNAGGIAVAINLENGTLFKDGYYKPNYGRMVHVHPDSGITLEGFRLPFFKESIEMISKVHRYLYGIHSIGWDIAISPDGPVLIEANEDWDGSFAMAVEEKFKSKFMQYYSKQ